MDLRTTCVCMLSILLLLVTGILSIMVCSYVFNSIFCKIVYILAVKVRRIQPISMSGLTVCAHARKCADVCLVFDGNMYREVNLANSSKVCSLQREGEGLCKQTKKPNLKLF